MARSCTYPQVNIILVTVEAQILRSISSLPLLFTKALFLLLRKLYDPLYINPWERRCFVIFLLTYTDINVYRILARNETTQIRIDTRLWRFCYILMKFRFHKKIIEKAQYRRNWLKNVFTSSLSDSQQRRNDIGKLSGCVNYIWSSALQNLLIINYSDE